MPYSIVARCFATRYFLHLLRGGDFATRKISRLPSLMGIFRLTVIKIKCAKRNGVVDVYTVITINNWTYRSEQTKMISVCVNSKTRAAFNKANHSRDFFFFFFFFFFFQKLFSIF